MIFVMPNIVIFYNYNVFIFLIFHLFIHCFDAVDQMTEVTSNL